ncbi:MAG: hypothetical protein IPL49_14535 [Saprospirales bacterium]|nr:hypothetical protein [Saprospirales bacterium]
MRSYLLLLISFLLTPFLFLHAQSGTLDPTFGTGGVTITPVSVGYDAGYGLAIQPDGKILVSGESQNGTTEGDYDVTLVRYKADGSLDAGFGNGGIVVKHISNGWDLSGSVLVQPDGMIVVGGQCWSGSTYDFVALRYKADGSPDNAFGNGGMVKIPVGSSQDNAWDCALQPDGKILLVGPVINGSNYAFGVVRLNTNGTMDNNFGNGGKVITSVGPADDFSWSCAVQPDGKILVAGRTVTNNVPAFALVRYKPDGTLDSSFGNGGKVKTTVGGVSDRGRVVVVQPDGKILVGGTSTIAGSDDFAVVRYKSDGTLDPTFGNNGIVTTPVGTGEDVLWDVVIEPTGKIIAAGYGINPVTGYDFALVKFKANGTLDTSFGLNGIAFGPISAGSDFANAVALQDDGKIVMAGTRVGTSYDIAVARFENTLTGVFSLIGADAISLFECFPDPFEAATQVHFQLEQAGFVILTVHDLSGRAVARLVSERLASGRHTRTFDANGLLPGLYVFRLQVEGVERSIKAVRVGG